MTRLGISFFLIVGFVSSSLLPADVLEFDWVDRGWYQADGLHHPDLDNYIVGHLGVTLDLEYRNFFVFDLTSLNGPIQSAQLMIHQPMAGYNSPDRSETFALWEVETAADVVTSGENGIAVFEDLGSGDFYGEIVVFEGDVNQFITIDLNANAIDDINSSPGEFIFGGSLTSLTAVSGVQESIFGNSGGAPVRLVVQTIPEPNVTAAILFLAMISCCSHKRR